MVQAILSLLLYSLLAALSALAFAATIAVMSAGRLKALGFATGFVLAQLLTCSLLVLIGVAATGSSRKAHSGVQATLALVLALGLVAFALQIRRRPPARREGSSERTQALLERLGRLRLLTTLLAGLILGIGGPKRLVLTALAATTITTAGFHDPAEAALVVLYTAVATALVWGPVILFVLLGDRVVAIMKDAQNWVARHQPDVIVYALLVLAALLVLNAISVLF
jgi:hypothetical protein